MQSRDCPGIPPSFGYATPAGSFQRSTRLLPIPPVAFDLEKSRRELIVKTDHWSRVLIPTWTYERALLCSNGNYRVELKIPQTALKYRQVLVCRKQQSSSQGRTHMGMWSPTLKRLKHLSHILRSCLCYVQIMFFSDIKKSKRESKIISFQDKTLKYFSSFGSKMQILPIWPKFSSTSYISIPLMQDTTLLIAMEQYCSIQHHH